MISSEEIKINVGLTIKELRNNAGITQEKLAEELGLQLNTIAKIETGKIYITSKTLSKLCNYFNVSPAIFFMPKVQINVKDNLDYIAKINELLPACNNKTLNIVYNTAIVVQNGQ